MTAVPFTFEEVRKLLPDDAVARRNGGHERDRWTFQVSGRIVEVNARTSVATIYPGRRQVKDVTTAQQVVDLLAEGLRE